MRLWWSVIASTLRRGPYEATIAHHMGCHGGTLLLSVASGSSNLLAGSRRLHVCHRVWDGERHPAPDLWIGQNSSLCPCGGEHRPALRSRRHGEPCPRARPAPRG